MDANKMHTTGESTSPSHIETSTPPAQPYAPHPLPVTLEPVVAEAVPTPEPQLQPQPSSPGIIVLQWLTYAFWGWLILGLLWLMSVILINAILHESVNEVVPYAIAASVVVLPLAFFCDFFYRKHEPVKKMGAAVVIMVIHAVLFALLGIGSLIIAAFTGINALINVGTPLDNQMVILYITLFATLLYAGAFLRTLNPFKAKKVTLIYDIGMVVITVVLLVLAVVGPVVSSLETRGDRAIEQALPAVQESVNGYINKNNKLPASLNDVTYSTTDAANLVKDNKVQYKANGFGADISLNNNFASASTTYRYQLCVDYKGSKNDSSTQNTSTGDNGYSSYITTYSHGAGHTCYNVEQTVYQKTY